MWKFLSARVLMGYQNSSRKVRQQLGCLLEKLSEKNLTELSSSFQGRMNSSFTENNEKTKFINANLTTNYNDIFKKL